MSLLQHAIDVLLWCAIVVAPIPLCLAFIGMGARDGLQASRAHVLLSVLILWCAITALVGLVLLVAHAFLIAALLLAGLVLFALGILPARRTVQRSSIDFLRMLSAPSFTVLEWGLIAAFAFVTVAFLWSAMANTPTAYDDFAFHLPTMAQWYQSHALLRPNQISQSAAYPFNWEIVAATSLLPFREDLFVFVPNLAAWLILGLSIYLLARQVGAARLPALVGAFLVMMTPIVYAQMTTMHVDLAFGAFFMAAAYCGIRFHRSRSPSDLALLLIALGVLAGIKTPGFIYGAFLVAVLVLLEVPGWIRGRRLAMPPIVWDRTALLIVGTALLVASILSGFWCARNLVAFGNPLGQARVAVAGHVIFPGRVGGGALMRTTLANRIDFGDPRHWDLLWREAADYLHLPFLGLVGLTLAFSLSLLVGVRFRSRSESLALLVLVAGTAMLYWNTPGSAANGAAGDFNPNMGWQLRYAIPFLGLLGVTAALGASALRLRHGALVVISLVLGLSVLRTAVGGVLNIFEQPLLLVVVVGACFVWGVLPRRTGPVDAPQGPNWRTALIPATGVAVLLAVLIAVSFAARDIRTVARRQSFFSLVDFIEKRTQPGDTIGYFASHKSYLLYGEHFDRRAILLRAGAESLSQWTESLRSRDIELVAVGPPDAPTQPEWLRREEREWLQDPEGAFVYVFGDNAGRSARIFRLIDDADEIRDEFSRPDSLSLGMTTKGSRTWQPLGGALHIAQGQLTGSGAAVIDSGSGDVVIDIKEEGLGAGIVFRYADNGNFWLWSSQGDGTNVLYRYQNGVVADIGNYGAAGSKSMRVYASGESIRVFRDGEVAGEVADPALATATKHGVSINPDTGGAITDFRIRRFSGGSATPSVAMR